MPTIIARTVRPSRVSQGKIRSNLAGPLPEGCAKLVRVTQLATLPVGRERFVIRRATAGDIAAIVALLCDDELGAGREDMPAAGLAPYRSAFDAVEADPRQMLLVVTAGDGSVAATMQLTFIACLSRRGAQPVAAMAAARPDRLYLGPQGEAMI